MSPDYLGYGNGYLYFSADDCVNGAELWRSDGTALGTVLVKDIFPGSRGSVAAFATALGSYVYVCASDGASGYELWRTDGTAGGTTLVKDIFPGAGDSLPMKLVAVSGVLYFTATDGFSGQEAWRSDGSAAGTYMLKDANPGAEGGMPAPTPELNNNVPFDKLPVTTAGRLILAVTDGALGVEPWRTDGTAASTVLWGDVNVGPEPSSPGSFAVAGGLAFFAADDGTVGRELWAVSVAGPGAVPDGSAVAGTPLTLQKSGGSALLTWGGSCNPLDADYAVYAGTLGSFGSHAPVTCSTGGATSTLVGLAGGDAYYLVVPARGVREGSYGRDSAGAERPQGSPSCYAQELNGCPY